MKTTNRLDPSLLSAKELDELGRAFAQPGHVALVDDEGNRTEIPEELFRHLTRIMRLAGEGRAVVMVPVDEKFTTQAAADYLGVSRQHLVDLLEANEIPFSKTGTHRRVVFTDLLAYEERRDQKRGHALDKLFEKVDEAGFYDGDFAGSTR